MSPHTAISVRQLRRSYRRGRNKPELVALNGIDLEIGAGEVHGLLGPNGAGKSTLCKILSTVLEPTSGTVHVLGHDVTKDKQQVRRKLALVLGGERGLYGRLTAMQNLRFWAALYGYTDREATARASALLERVGLADRENDRVETYSRGMKQRLHLARGLIADPAVILLDEPTVGMDPVATKDFQSLIREIRPGRTILLATHDMVEAEALCDRVSMINGGNVVATETPQTLASWITQYERIDVGRADETLVEKLRLMEGVGRVVPGEGGGVRVETVAEGAAVAVLRLLVDLGHTDLRTSLPSLEEVYFHLLGPKESV